MNPSHEEARFALLLAKPEAKPFSLSRNSVKQEVRPGFSIIKQGANLIAMIQPAPDLAGIIDE
jgi:hypothetical protein